MTASISCTFEDRKTQDAVGRNLEIIGEATKRVSLNLKTANPDIAWKPIAGMRDKLIHDYFGVNVQLGLRCGGTRSATLLREVERTPQDT